jgi:hypothetical protein
MTGIFGILGFSATQRYQDVAPTYEFIFIVAYIVNGFLSTFSFLSTAIGRLCEKCDGKCVICDSYVRPCTLVRICDECNYGSYQGRCVICGGPGVSDAYYCKECTILEKDVRLQSSRLESVSKYQQFNIGLFCVSWTSFPVLFLASCQTKPKVVQL